jgi:7-cyano-7-deazaguanine synthase
MDAARPRALLLLSGGLDSAVALWWARAEGLDVIPLSFTYPGRPRGEARAARALAERAGTPPPLEAHLPFLREARDAGWADAPRGYVPARNALFYAAAVHHAELLACGVVIGGHNGGDGERFPDATRAFFTPLEALLAQGLWRTGSDVRAPPRLLMPLLDLTKRDVVALGRRLGAPLELAWSCYEDGPAACGACPACVENATLPLARA